MICSKKVTKLADMTVLKKAKKQIRKIQQTERSELK
jgi:hypothetical protein